MGKEHAILCVVSSDAIEVTRGSNNGFSTLTVDTGAVFHYHEVILRSCRSGVTNESMEEGT